MAICSTQPSTSNALGSDGDKIKVDLSPKLMLESIRTKAAIGAHFQLYSKFENKVRIYLILFQMNNLLKYIETICFNFFFIVTSLLTFLLLLSLKIKIN